MHVARTAVWRKRAIQQQSGIRRALKALRNARTVAAEPRYARRRCLLYASDVRVLGTSLSLSQRSSVSRVEMDDSAKERHEIRRLMASEILVLGVGCGASADFEGSATCRGYGNAP